MLLYRPSDDFHRNPLLFLFNQKTCQAEVLRNIPLRLVRAASASISAPSKVTTQTTAADVVPCAVRRWRVTAVGPTLSPTAQSENSLTPFRVTVVAVELVRVHSHPSPAPSVYRPTCANAGS